MDPFRLIADRKIQEAMEEGAFENLSGRGRPLPLDDDPFEDPSLRMAHRLLRNNGFAPAWIEEARDLELAIERARQDFARASASCFAEDRYRILEAFHGRIAEINRRILSHNLKTPSSRFHMQ